ncbi:neuromedin Bb [Takifugu rubripes]|uniref:neuromedin Bb n=1 Tax=Takifugu rubripes TaxID=31033 RepID=UPI0011454544|nr:neuromedin-B [Takifugu rubripes]
MRGFAPSAVCQCGVFTSLLLFSFLYFTAAVSFDLTELRNKVAKIKVNPRGNLWATGHFMGKKSVKDSPLLPPPQAADAPAEQSAPAELLHEFLRVALREQVETRDSGAKNQEADLLLKILESYFQSRK